MIPREEKVRSDEPTGEPISLSGMISATEMGMYATKSKPKLDDKNKKKEEGQTQSKRMANQTQFVNPKKKTKIVIKIFLIIFY